MRFSTCVAHFEPLGYHLAAHFLDSRMSGHIHLHRKIRDSAVYQDSKTLHLWLELLLRASWKQCQLLNGVTLEPGQLICGQEELGESIGLSRREVRTRLQQLENCGNVTSKTTNAGTHITICNWATYQLLPDAERPAKRPASDQQATNDRPASDQRATTEEEGKESKEGKKVIHKGSQARRFVPPSVDEVSSYCNQRSNHVDASQFVDHYEARGWMIGKNKMKDWKAAVRTWERNGHSNGKTNGKVDKSIFSLEPQE